ncbi:cellulose biosynthesis cyclic di-GMP-binding regulatory protein BcsB [Escherichia coli]
MFGRDDKDLLQAAKGIAQGNILFRGESVVVNEKMENHAYYRVSRTMRRTGYVPMVRSHLAN